MKINKNKNPFLIQISLLLTAIFFISIASITFIPSETSEYRESTEIEKNFPKASGYRLEWDANGVQIFDDPNTHNEDVNFRICTDESEGAIVVWTDCNATGDRNIYAQRILSNGTKVWGSNGVIVCNYPGDQTNIRISKDDGAGGVVIVWEDWRNGGTQSDIYAQWIDNTGTPQWTLNGTLVCGALYNQRNPQVQIDDFGAIIGWEDWRNGGTESDIYAQKILWNENKDWGTNDFAVCNSTGNQQNLYIIFIYGHKVFTWEDNRNGELDIYAQFVHRNGYAMWTPNGTTICNATGVQTQPRGCFGESDEDSIIMWCDNRTGPSVDIYAQYIYKNGTLRWSDNGTLICSDTYELELEGSVVFNELDVQICHDDGDKGAIIGWIDDRLTFVEDHQIYGQKILPNGTTVWADNGCIICDFTSGKSWKENLRLYRGDDGDSLFVWCDGRYEDGDIYIQKIASDGSKKWGSNAAALCAVLEPQEEPEVCSDEKGGAIIAWFDERDGNHDDIYAQKIIEVPDAPIISNGGDDGGGGSSAEDSITPLFILGGIIGLAAMVMVVAYRSKKKKKARDLLPYQKAIEMSRGFEVAGDTFRFFVRVQNTLGLAITNVSVKIIPPHTLKLDKKSPSREFLIGDIKSGKFGTAIFYLFCVACADTEINAEIDYMDPEGNLQIEKMHPFPIMSCKFVKPRKISVEEFEEEYQAKEKKTIEIRLSEGISDERAMKMIKDRLTMSTVASSSNSLAMSGKAKDGSDILLKSMIKEIEGVKTAIASVVSSNQYVTMGVLSDFMETFSDFREEAIAKFDGLERGQEEIKETVIREARKILDNQIVEYELIESRNLELQEKIQGLAGKVDELELKGDFSQANEIKQQIESLNLEFRKSNQLLEAKIEEMVNNVDEVFVELGEKFVDLEQYLKDHLASAWEKLKDSWNDYKEGKINRKQLLWRAVKISGPKILSKIFNLLIGKII